MAFHSRSAWPKFIRTRNPHLGLSCLDKNLWRFCDITDPSRNPSPVGPSYRSKTEALADLSSYERSAGWVG